MASQQGITSGVLPSDGLMLNGCKGGEGRGRVSAHSVLLSKWDVGKWERLRGQCAPRPEYGLLQHELQMWMGSGGLLFKCRTSKKTHPPPARQEQPSSGAACTREWQNGEKTERDKRRLVS